VDNLSLTSNVNEYVRDEHPVPGPEWSQVPYFGAATRAALIMLDDAGRVALIEKTAPTIKTLVQSDTFAKAHADYIRQQYNAVDHGLKGVMGMDALMKKQDFAGAEAFGKRQTAMIIVDNIEGQKAADIQRALGFELQNWRSAAKQSTGASQAKYQRFVKDGEALVALGTSDEAKLRRGYAVLKSIDVDGEGADRLGQAQPQARPDGAAHRVRRARADGGLCRRDGGEGQAGKVRQGGLRAEGDPLESLLQGWRGGLDGGPAGRRGVVEGAAVAPAAPVIQKYT
jgi:hypothetical protein